MAPPTSCSGILVFSVSIAAEIDDTTVAGVVADPMHGDLYTAALGHGARRNGEAIAPRPTTDLALAIVATGFSFNAERRSRQAATLSQLLPNIADIRRMGSAAIDLCSVASGRVDAYFEVGLNHWDLAAGALIAAEAGAVVRYPTESAGPDPTPTIAVAAGIADALFEALAPELNTRRSPSPRGPMPGCVAVPTNVDARGNTDLDRRGRRANPHRRPGSDSKTRAGKSSRRVRAKRPSICSSAATPTSC